MALPLVLDVVVKVVTCRPFLSSLAFSQHGIMNNGRYMIRNICHKTQTSICANGITYACAATISHRSSSSCFSSRATTTSSARPSQEPGYSTSILPVPATVLSRGLKPALPCLVSSRQYGRKVPQKPPKITHFQYSGDLRTLPALDKSIILSKYQGFEDELEKNEVLRKLSSLEFASAEEYADHRRQLVKDRIIELFGPDSEIEQKIALLTLGIRQMIPYCIKYRGDKLNKIFLLKRIFRRRRLLTNLREIDHERFEWLLRELKIRYVVPKDREPHKGWKHNLRVATVKAAMKKQRTKLEELKEKFEVEKKVFFEHKAKVLSQIEEDLKQFGLDKSFLDKLLLEKNSSKQGLQHEQKNKTSHQKQH